MLCCMLILQLGKELDFQERKGKVGRTLLWRTYFSHLLFFHTRKFIRYLNNQKNNKLKINWNKITQKLRYSGLYLALFWSWTINFFLMGIRRIIEIPMQMFHILYSRSELFFLLALLPAALLKLLVPQTVSTADWIADFGYGIDTKIHGM